MINKNKKVNKNNEFFLITKDACPEALIDVLKVKDLVEKKKMKVATASDLVGISRTTYYKYCNSIFYFDETPSTKTITLDLKTNDKVGILSKVTNAISKNKFNILTINQTEPVNEMNIITIQIVMTDKKCNLSTLTSELKKISDVVSVKIKKLKDSTNE